MADRKFNMHDGKKGSALAVRVTPRASRNEIVEILEDGTVRVRLAASPAAPIRQIGFGICSARAAILWARHRPGGTSRSLAGPS